MNRLVAAVLALSLISSSSAFAKAASGPSTHNRTLNLTGSGGATPPQNDVGPNGQCNVGFANQCPSSAGTANVTCLCVEVANLSATGSIEKGKMSASDFFVTIDQGINPATQSPPGMSGPDGRCNLFFGVVTVTSSAESKTVNFMGQSCKHVIAVTPKNPTGKHDRDTLSGGWGISNSPAPNPDASGWGTMTGKVTGTDNDNPKISLKLTGMVTQ